MVHTADGPALGATEPAAAPVAGTTAAMLLTPTPVASPSSRAANSTGPAPAPHPPPGASAPAVTASTLVTSTMGPMDPTAVTARRSPLSSSTTQPPLPSPPPRWIFILAPLSSVPSIAGLAPMQLVVHSRGIVGDAAAAAAAAGLVGLVSQLLPLRPSGIKLIKAADRAHAARINPAVLQAVPEYAAQRYAAVKSLLQINASTENFRYSIATLVRTVDLADAYTQRVFTGSAPAAAAAAAATDRATRPLLAAPQWQLLTVACLSLAAVIDEEYDDPVVADLAAIVEPHQYTAASVRDAKRSVAVTLEYHLSRPTAMDALYELLRTPGLDLYLAPFLQPFAEPTTELVTGWQDEQQRGLLPSHWLNPLIGITQQYLLAALGDTSLLGAHPLTVEAAPGTTSCGAARHHLFCELAIDVSSPVMAASAHTVAFCAARMSELLPRIEFLEVQFDGFVRSRLGLVSPPPTPTAGNPAGHASWPAAAATTAP
ncbi:hypothetical protein AMAG_09390 [Allomyces macrogynus ATCC 38327]|uniref:Uncharacterized protein n=1 Tax=Allomyces macrogynus (strain ATCC 38327) TaxID=578462 RepID=A0A0L0SPD4_ALLM3|nr:hypothetical protein AMAG_09390 [Allomyces macrogynus ATCC 38327]|eukprot:KNE64363.1 hypothetical protein AMAG_09390 [Allomyces macrogynus ATCC 38327]